MPKINCHQTNCVITFSIQCPLCLKTYNKIWRWGNRKRQFLQLAETLQISAQPLVYHGIAAFVWFDLVVSVSGCFALDLAQIWHKPHQVIRVCLGNSPCRPRYNLCNSSSTADGRIVSAHLTTRLPTFSLLRIAEPAVCLPLPLTKACRIR